MEHLEQLEALLAKVRPSRCAVVDDADAVEWVAVPRGKDKWRRLATMLLERSWRTVRLCDGRGATVETVRRDDPGAPDVAAPPASTPSAGVGVVEFGRLLADTVQRVVATTTQALATTVATVRQESRAELEAVLTAHVDMSRGAFAERARAVEEASAAAARVAELEAAVAELQARLAAAAAEQPTSQAEAREGALLRLLAGGAAGGGGPAGGNQGMPSGS